MIKKFLILILTVMLALSANFVYADDSTYYSESELKTFESSPTCMVGRNDTVTRDT